MICRHWWAYQDNDHKMHWLSLDKLTLPKKEGGLGYKDLHAFNMAMLAKQAWRLLTDPRSLCGRVLKARYHPDTSVLLATPTEGISYSWRSILKGVDLLNMGVIKQVGDGSSINLWLDPWLPETGAESQLPPEAKMSSPCCPSFLTLPLALGTRDWWTTLSASKTRLSSRLFLFMRILKISGLGNPLQRASFRSSRLTSFSGRIEKSPAPPVKTFPQLILSAGP
jgi:hypothetical protein